MGKKFKSILLEGKYFEYVFLVAMMAISIPVIHPFIGRFSKITVLWAFLCILYDIKVTKKIFKVPLSKPIILFGLFWLFSVLMNYQNNLVGNVTFFCYGVIYIWVLYPKYANDNERMLEKFLNFFCSLTFISSIVSVIMFLMRYKTLFNDYIIGYHMGRLYGVYVSPNTGGIYALIAAVASIFIIFHWQGKNKLLIRILHGVNIFIQVSYISLTDSNGTKITYITFVLLIVFALIYHLLKEKKVFVRIALSVCFSILCVITCIGVFKGIGTVYSYLPSILEKVNTPNEEEKEEDDELTAIAIKRKYEDEQFAAGRVEIWKIGFKILGKSPIYGVAHENVQDVAEIVEPKKTDITDKISSGMHNLYMEVLVETGLVGFIIFTIILIAAAKELLKYYFVTKQICGSHAKLLLLISLIGAMAVNNFGECTILFCQSGIGIVFWLVIGYVLPQIDQEV